MLVLQLSSTGILSGQATFDINGSLNVYTAITNITGLVGEADLNFAVAVTLGTGTGSTVTMDELRLDLE